MFKIYLTIAIRNLMKNKIFTAVNILGLAIGMAASVYIHAGDVALTKYKRSFF